MPIRRVNCSRSGTFPTVFAMIRPSHLLSTLCIGIAASWISYSFAQQGDGTNEQMDTHVFKPDKVAATPERIQALHLPKGFEIAPYATDLKNVRMLAVAPGGRVYATRRDQADLLLLQDLDQDGVADAPPRIVASRAGLHGIAISGQRIFLVTVKELFTAPLLPDGSMGPLEMLLGDLPDGGQHANRTIAVGPDGMLYLSVGSTCNACNETSPESATILRISPDGTQRSIYASGLRNTIGFDWELQTGELWGLDHGIDYLGDEAQPEELNQIRMGKTYGWPHVFADGPLNPQSTPPGEVSKEQWKSISVPMVLGLDAHAAPMQLRFYTGAGFPAEYQGDAFATLRGSWNRKRASGYQVVRIRFEQGRPTHVEPFITGFLVDGGKTHFARPVGLAQLPDGSLLIGDDANGVIYRVRYTGGQPAAQFARAAPATAMEQQAAQGMGVALAASREQARASAALAVSSPAFAANAPIPDRYSEYHDGVSPPLQWTAVGGAKSYALIMEDTDSKPVTPFVHWVAWNLPPTLQGLPEGLAEQMRLTEPAGVMQGRTSRGSHGYFGPRPPVGDPPHHYHVQIFALDTMLDVPLGSDRDTVLAAMSGHVLAKGAVVGTYRQRIKPPK